MTSSCRQGAHECRRPCGSISRATRSTTVPFSTFRFDAGTLREVKFTIECPNVKRFEHGDFTFVDVSYDVTLHAVDCLQIQQHAEQLSRNVAYPRFGYCEIETCEEEIRDAVQRTRAEHHSLIIEAELFTLTLVFQQLQVVASEPEATERMMRDPRYKFPFCEP
jgi:hypothetical protein